MWPQLTNIEKEISNTIKSRADTKVASKLNPWVRIISGAVVEGIKGLIIVSNNDFKLFKAVDENFGAIYGDKSASGAIGYDLENKKALASAGLGRGFRPSPIIKSLSIKEGKDQISRELEISIECFSKDQMELLQAFLMEPGYNLCVEYGYNTVQAMSEMIDTKKSLDEILNSVADRCLNQDNIHKARVSSNGEYDIFLGFIVGGTVTSQGENFELTIKCKGAPGLPTFLQTHKKTQELTIDGKVKEKPTIQPFAASELKNDSEATAAFAAKRRFKTMFNDLPAEKQIDEIKKLVDTNEYTMYDFIGYDEVVNESLLNFESSGGWDFLNVFGKKKIKVGSATLKKEGIFPNYKFISMNLAAKLLNKNGGLDHYKIRGKEIKVKIDIDNCVIGAFPYMFSTKADKLIIPGTLPPFKEYFLNTTDVQQKANGIISDSAAVDYSILNIRFPQNTALAKFGHKEDANYWGYLKHLYVNFDVFKSKITQQNKNIREIFLDILNEISTGANSFWNFQIVESTVTKEKPVDGLSEGDIVITVIDENWVGKNSNDEPPTRFIHAGIESAFTNADLDISIPQDMTNAIVGRRLSLATNPNSAIVNTGELFNSEMDLFMNKVTLPPDDDAKPNDTPPPPKESEDLRKKAEDIQKDINKLEADNKKLQQEIREFNIERNKNMTYGQVVSESKKQDANPNHPVTIRRKKLKENQKKINESTLLRNEQLIKANAAEKKEEEDAKAAEQAKLSQNFDKICIVPNPSYFRLGKIDNTALRNKEETFGTGGRLRIYTLNDGNYFDRLRNDAFNPKGTGKNDRLSHPLPIKYTFTTIGISGLRRGDTFNILGIPEKYEKHGLFQITEVEQSLTDMDWKTTVTGEYRQKNS